MHLHDRAGTLASLLLYKAEKPSVCLSVCPDRHAAISAVSACIETRLARYESTVFWDNEVCFKNSTRAITHPHECAKGTGVS